MTSRSSITCIIFSLLLWSSCKRGPYQSATTELADFLHTQLRRAIPEERHYFVLVPSNKCPKCISLDGSDYGKDFASRLTIISSIDAENFRHLDDVVFDENNMVLKMGFIDYSPKIVVSEKGSIISVLNFDGNTRPLDSLCRLEHKPPVATAPELPAYPAAVSEIQTSTLKSIQAGY